VVVNAVSNSTVRISPEGAFKFSSAVSAVDPGMFQVIGQFNVVGLSGSGTMIADFEFPKGTGVGSYYREVRHFT